MASARHEVSDYQALHALHALGEPHLRDRPCNQMSEGGKAAVDHRARASTYTDIPRLQDLERDGGRVDQIAQFMGEESHALVADTRLTVETGLLTFPSIHRDGV